MKSPRDIYNEKRGKKVSTPPGGRAYARQQQFEQERTAGKPAKKDDACDDNPGGGKK